LNKLFFEKEKNLDLFAIKNQNLFDMDLKFLFEYFNSDKGEKYYNQYQKSIKLEKKLIDGHQYHRFYENYFSDRKKDQLDILEIGTFKGNATAAFYFYFKNANITSVDIFPDLIRYNSKRIKNFYLDNSQEHQIEENIIKKNLTFDLIIEDAGHYYKDQIISLFILFRSLKKNGIFVIEELDFPDTRHDMNPEKKKPTLRDILKSVKENNDFNSELVSLDQKEYFLKNLSSLEIFKGNFNEIAFIKKK
jgi:predicted O-methyltransferase YrrM